MNASSFLNKRLWSEQKIKDGWVYGPTKDEVNKTHHCLVDFKDLPIAQQQKDYIFLNVVRSFKDSGILDK
jgi:hypothetical protein